MPGHLSHGQCCCEGAFLLLRVPASRFWPETPALQPRTEALRSCRPLTAAFPATLVLLAGLAQRDAAQTQAGLDAEGRALPWNAWGRRGRQPPSSQPLINHPAPARLNAKISRFPWNLPPWTAPGWGSQCSVKLARGSTWLALRAAREGRALPRWTRPCRSVLPQVSPQTSPSTGGTGPFPRHPPPTGFLHTPIR